MKYLAWVHILIFPLPVLNNVIIVLPEVFFITQAVIPITQLFIPATELQFSFIAY